jgi:hypothetical protein
LKKSIILASMSQYSEGPNILVASGRPFWLIWQNFVEISWQHRLLSLIQYTLFGQRG